jgi:type II secretory pathway component GspD/PulD (secretin)
MLGVIRKVNLLMVFCLMMSGAAMGQRDEDDPKDYTALKEQLSGDTITLSVEDMEMTSLLKLLSQARRVNIVAGSEVEGEVSINLFDVSFENALESILGVGGFSYFKKGDVYIVTSEESRAALPMGVSGLKVKGFQLKNAAPETITATLENFLSPYGILSVSRNGLVIVQDTQEYINLIGELVKDLDVPPNEARVIELNHLPVEDAITTVSTLMSSLGQALVSGPKKIVIQDGAEYLNTIEALLKDLDVAPRQVHISSKLLTVSHEENTGLGVDLSWISNPTDTAFTQGFVGDASDPDADGLTGFFTAVTHNSTAATVQALEGKSDVEIIASPNITVLDGEEARIQVGDRLGFRQTFTTDTASLESVEFLDVGTVLEVTPSITNDGLIRMDVHPEVSTGELDENGLPSERTTDVSTTMIVKNGETIVIGGLLDGQKQRIRSQVPILGDIPLLGLAFGRNTWIERKVELVILITPNIVGHETEPMMLPQIAQVKQTEQLFVEVEDPIVETPERTKQIRQLERPDKRFRNKRRSD